MWLPWLLKSPSTVPSYSLPDSPLSSSTTPTRFTTSFFQFSTLRDVQSLMKEEDVPTPPHSPLHRTSSSVFNSSSILSHHTKFVRSLPNNINRRTTASTAGLITSQPPDAHNRIVVYYTSLHVIRRTYQDCRAVRAILKAFHNVKIDERDVSMDSSFLEEIRGLVVTEKWQPGGSFDHGQLALPRVFINGKYVGGVEEIETLHESGDLNRMIDRLSALTDDDGIEEHGGICCACGGFRFVVCQHCDGSRKVYEERTGFSSCNQCDQNGLIRCRQACISVIF